MTDRKRQVQDAIEKTLMELGALSKSSGAVLGDKWKQLHSRFLDLCEEMQTL